MDADNTYHPYSGADILRYLDGRMTSQEMRQLELAAMDDPFLEDAIDGYREAYANSSKEKLIAGLEAAQAYKAEQKYKVEVEDEEKEKERKAIVIPFWRKKAFQMAVAATVVLGTGWYIFSVTNNGGPFKSEEKQAIVATTTTDSATPAEVSTELAKADATKSQYKATDTDATPSTGNTVVSDLATISKTKDLPQLPAAAPGAPVTLSNNEIAAAENLDERANHADSSFRESIAARKQSVTESKKTEKAFDDAVATVVIPTTSAKSRGLSQQHLEDTKLQKISGLVVDGEKYPLDNITLRIKGAPGTTLSDELGRFEMILPDTNATLIASGAGYKTKEFNTKSSVGFSNKKLELQLEPERSLEEEVVMGYMKKRAAGNAKQIVLEMDTTEAAPVGGWDNFTKYVKQNKRFKDRPGSLSIAVVINFEVDKNGKPSEFDIIKSGGDAYDKEAIRLLKEGPIWKIKIEGEETGAVKITMVL